MRTLTLNNDLTLPAFGLGTWKSAPGEVKRAVTHAVEIGYRHIDCAWIYGNEAEIGEAFADLFARGVVKREDLWVTSKLWNDRHLPADVAPAIEESLERLGLDYLDLYLIHWPVAHKPGVVMPDSAEGQLSPSEAPMADTWGAMEALVEAGKARSIGVSNLNAKALTALCQGARFKPVMNQVELHPYLQQADLVKAGHDLGVAFTAYSPLGSNDRAAQMKRPDEPVLLEDPTINEIAEARGLSPAQILIAWALTRGTAVIPKSVNPERLAQNLAASEIVLTDDEMGQIAKLERDSRYIDGSFWAKPGGAYTIDGLWVG